jgi:hypothetical protein
MKDGRRTKREKETREREREEERKKRERERDREREIGSFICQFVTVILFCSNIHKLYHTLTNNNI